MDRKWRKTEDDLLSRLVFEHGKNNFLYIGSHFENRTPLQCSSRWLKSTAPYIRSGEWDKMEDIQCVLSHNSYLPHTKPEIIYSVNNRYHPSWKNPYQKEEKIQIIDNNDDESTPTTTNT